MPKGVFERPVRALVTDCNGAKVSLGRGHFALIDLLDADLVGRWNWGVSLVQGRSPYALRGIYLGGGRDSPIRKTLSMHRQIMDAPDGVQVDHINGDGLDNRRSNLRLCTNQQNAFNKLARRGSKSGIKGVMPNRNRWMAQICVSGITHHLGTFDTIPEAAAVYEEAAKRYHGDFARF